MTSRQEVLDYFATASAEEAQETLDCCAAIMRAVAKIVPKRGRPAGSKNKLQAEGAGE